MLREIPSGCGTTATRIACNLMGSGLFSENSIGKQIQHARLAAGHHG